MKYSLLGKSGLRVSELALGAMTCGTEWGWGTEKNEARKMLDLYIDNGGNFVDTANVYTNGSSEKMLGEFLGEKRQQIVRVNPSRVAGMTRSSCKQRQLLECHHSLGPAFCLLLSGKIGPVNVS